MTSYKTIYIAGINRSGGSLLSRLYDNHSSILSYPTELGFPSDNSFYDIVDSYAGVPQSIPDYFKSQDQDLFSLLDLPKKQACLLYTSPSPRDGLLSRMPSSA
mgnify:CR=1 FL=1